MLVKGARTILNALWCNVLFNTYALPFSFHILMVVVRVLGIYSAYKNSSRDAATLWTAIVQIQSAFQISRQGKTSASWEPTDVV